MSEGHELEFADATYGHVISSVLLFQTTRKDVGWGFGLWGVCDDSNYEVDIGDGCIVVGEENVVDFYSPQTPLRTNVFNIEVEDFHTYYVGESGLWVRNTNCG